ncbi:MAG: acyl carrier protein [Lachnospiraceae bacterium]|jgi:acyl carrier protein|nr:acyl carrier protein [Lachnospiraceae bacterium]
MEFERFAEIISEVLNIDVDEITPESNFVDDLGADSLDMAEIITQVEDELDVETDVEDFEEIATVGDALEKIRQYAV